jgi:hypothetical protein
MEDAFIAIVEEARSGNQKGNTAERQGGAA